MDNTYFDNQEWLNARLGRFTASEISKLFVGPRSKSAGMFGDTAMTYIRTKAAEILTQEVKEEINFKQAEHGKATEPFACAAFEKKMGIKGYYFGASEPKFYEFGDFEGCSPDWEGLQAEAGADFKCPYNSSEHLKNLAIPSAAELKEERFEYYSQLQFSMLRRGWKVAYFVSYDSRFVYDWMQLKIIPVYPDSAWITEFETRIIEATKILKSLVKSFSNPDAFIATNDPKVGAIIIEPAQIKLQKI